MSDRRDFFKTAAAAGLALAATGKGAGALAQGEDNDGFIRSVQRARIFDLSHTWDENSPIASRIWWRFSFSTASLDLSMLVK